jgi:hypothetical protein
MHDLSEGTGNCLLVQETYRLFPSSSPLTSGSTSAAPRYLAITTASAIWIRDFVTGFPGI